MVSPHFFIVKPKGSEYLDEIEIAGQKIAINATLENHKNVNRFAEVINIPSHYEGEIKKGDILVVHHNIFRIYYDMKGRPRRSPNYFRDDIYIIDSSQFYLFHNGEKWQSVDDYCFVKPIDKENTYLYEKGDEMHTGIIVYSNKRLNSLGVKDNDKVNFTKNSEYEFTINDQRLFRMNTRDICTVIDG